MAFTRILSIVAASCVLLGGILSIVALYAGAWVEGRAVQSDSSDSVSSSVSLKPGSICTVYKSSGADNRVISQCFQGNQIKSGWSVISTTIEAPSGNDELPESVTASSTADILGNTYNLVVSGAIGCAACLVLYFPFLLREIRGGVTIIKCCGKWTAIFGSVAAGIGGILLLASYGVVADSDLAKKIVEWWSSSTVNSGSSSLSFTGEFTPVMDCAAAAGTAAVVGALLIIARGTVCIGDDDDADGIGETVSESDPFSRM